MTTAIQATESAMRLSSPILAAERAGKKVSKASYRAAAKAHLSAEAIHRQSGDRLAADTSKNLARYLSGRADGLGPKISTAADERAAVRSFEAAERAADRS